MATTAVNNYITKKYDRWLDYAKYQCGQVGIANESYDVLNEVLCSLVQKNDKLLERLLETKRNGYTELDFFVLKMIKLNATSPTSPYQNRYKPIPVDTNTDYSMMEIEDEEEVQSDSSGEQLEKMRKVRSAFEELDLSDLARRVFEFHFFLDLPFSEWEGEETQKQLYEMYNRVIELIRRKLLGEFIF